MHEAPLLSIVIPAHNEEKYIEKTLRTIFQHALDFPYEVLVIDNNSTDDTLEIIKKFDVTVISEKKEGLAYARQAGIDHARGEFILFNDADTLLPKKVIETFVSYLQHHKEVAGVSCNFSFYDGSRFDTIATTVFQKTVTPLLLFFLRLSRKPDIFNGNTYALRAEAIRKAGGTDKNFVFLGEDIITSYRLLTQGKVILIPNIFALTSARRYKTKGAIKTFIDYTVILFLIHFGFYEKAAKYSQSYNKHVNLI